MKIDISTLSQKEIDIAKQVLNIVIGKKVLTGAELLSMSDGDGCRANRIKLLLVDSGCARWNEISGNLYPTDDSGDKLNTDYLQYLYDTKSKEIAVADLDKTYKNEAINNMRFTRIISVVAILISLISLVVSLSCN